MKCLQLSPYEIRYLETCPQALLALCDYHVIQETEADAFDFPESAEFHRRRRAELKELAAYIQKFHDRGEYPVFDDEEE